MEYTPDFIASVRRLFGKRAPSNPHRTLRAIPWGHRDAKLARVVLRHMVDANPPVVLPWSPHMARSLRFLHTNGIAPESVVDTRREITPTANPIRTFVSMLDSETVANMVQRLPVQRLPETTTTTRMIR